MRRIDIIMLLHSDIKNIMNIITIVVIIFVSVIFITFFSLYAYSSKRKKMKKFEEEKLRKEKIENMLKKQEIIDNAPWKCSYCKTIINKDIVSCPSCGAKNIKKKLIN